jgi:hypothetical protein
MKKLEIKSLSIKAKKGFTLLSGINRPIIPAHVTKMAESVDEIGIVRPIVVARMDFISGEERTYIIDGQHLYMALLRLNNDMPYVEIEIKDSYELAAALAKLNNSSKSWSMQDYITVWSNIEEDYKTLAELHNVYDIELSQLAEILMDNAASHSVGRKTIHHSIKKGEFIINDREKGIELLDCITDALKVIPRLDRVSNKMFISSYVHHMNNTPHYDHNLFMKGLSENKRKFSLATQDLNEFKKAFKSLK